MREARALAVVVLLLLAGCSFGPLGPGTEPASEKESLTLTEEWTAGSSSIEGNHHAIGAGRVGDEAVVAIPLGGYHGKSGCKLLVVDGNGEERWTAAIPPDACTIHAVADPAVADFVGAGQNSAGSAAKPRGGDGRPEVITATTLEQVVARDPANGTMRFRFNLTDYGYTRPVVADVTGNDSRELVVTDVDGTLFVARPDGSEVWNRSLDAYSWSAPTVDDLDGDDDTEIAVGLGNGTAVAFDHRGAAAWRTALDGAITWTANGDVDGDGVGEFVVATDGGTVAALDGRDGSVDWERSLGSLAAVRGVADGDGDGAVEVYATAKDGRLRALAGESGETEWTTRLTNGSVQMTPPPVVGDVTGDGSAEIVAMTNDGYLRVVDPADGTVLASYHRDAAVYAHATLADTDGDGVQEIYAMYGDGTAVAVSTDGSSAQSSASSSS